MKKIAYGIRCHQYGAPEIKIYKTLLSMGVNESDIFFVVDETNNIVDFPYDMNKISMSSCHAYMEGLHFPENVGWLCGDYFYYALIGNVKADYYWLLEPDIDFGVKCNDFFNVANLNEEDFLALRLSSRRDSWYWYKSMSFYSDSVYGCCFPITRVSYDAVSFLYSQRISVSKKYLNKEISIFPNDEAFAATAIVNQSKSYADISKVYPANYSEFSTTVPRLQGTLQGDDKIFHPVLEWEDFKRKFPNRLNSALSNGTHEVYLKTALKGLNRSQVSQVFLASSSVFSKYLQK